MLSYWKNNQPVELNCGELAEIFSSGTSEYIIRHYIICASVYLSDVSFFNSNGDNTRTSGALTSTPTKLNNYQVINFFMISQNKNPNSCLLRVC